MSYVAMTLLLCYQADYYSLLAYQSMIISYEIDDKYFDLPAYLISLERL